MKPIRILLILALALSVTVPVFGGEPEFKKGEVIVEINPGVSIESINARHGTTVKQRLTIRISSGDSQGKEGEQVAQAPE
jgi:hypothetical protein